MSSTASPTVRIPEEMSLSPQQPLARPSSVTTVPILVFASSNVYPVVALQVEP